MSALEKSISEMFSEVALAYLAEHAIDPAVAAVAGVLERPDGLAFPYVDGDGTYERRMAWNGDGPRFRQPKGRRLTPWWPLGRPAPGADVLVCEGESDALAAASALDQAPLAEYRATPVCSIPGAAVAGRLGEELARLGVREAALAFDADDAGRKATERAVDALHANGIRPVPVGLPDGQDLSDALAAVPADRRGKWIAGLLLDAGEAARGDEEASIEAQSTIVDSPEGEWFTGAPMDPAAVAAEPLPTVAGFPYLHEGNAAVIVGPTGGGRSSLVQACAYDAARQGVRVVYLGSEVTEGEFNARAAGLAHRRGDAIDDALREQLARVRYLNLASTTAHAWQHPDEWVSEIVAHFDVVLIDPLSSVASALDLDFDTSNVEFVRFYDRLVQPLASAGVAVVMLDNIGHALEARSRAKGVSAKQDRADLTFSCKLKAQPVGLVITAHKVRTVRARFLRGDSWTFDRDTQRITRRNEGDGSSCEPAFRPTVLMERVSRAVEAEPGLTRTALRKAVQGKYEWKALALDLLIAEGYIEQREDAGNRTHFLTRRFPASAEGTGSPGSPGSHAVPDPFPAAAEGVGSPGSPPLYRGEPGTALDHHAHVERLLIDNADLEESS